MNTEQRSTQSCSGTLFNKTVFIVCYLVWLNTSLSSQTPVYSGLAFSSPPHVTTFPFPKGNLPADKEWALFLAHGILTTYLPVIQQIQYLDPFEILTINWIEIEPYQLAIQSETASREIYSHIGIDYYIWGKIAWNGKDFVTTLWLFKGAELVNELNVTTPPENLAQKVTELVPVLLSKIGISVTIDEHEIARAFIGTNYPNLLNLGNSIKYFYQTQTVDRNRAAESRRLGTQCIEKITASDPNYSWGWSLSGLYKSYSDLGSANQDMLKSVRKNPKNMDAIQSLAYIAKTTGVSEYHQYQKQSVDINPSLLNNVYNYLFYFYEQSQYSAGIAEADRLIAFYQNQPNTAGLALADAFKGIYLIQQGVKTEIADCYQAALNIKPADYDLNLVSALNSFAAALEKTSDRKKQAVLYAKAYEIGQRVFPAPHPVMMDLLYDYAKFLINDQQIEQAQKVCNESLQLAGKLYGEESPETARCLTVLGTIEQFRSNYAKAVEYGQRSVKIFEESDQTKSDNYVVALRILGDALNFSGQFDQALANYQKARTIARDLGKTADEAVCLKSIGMLYYQMKDINKAESAFNEGLALVQYQPGQVELINSFNNNLAVIATDKGNPAKALEMYILSLANLEKFYGIQHPVLLATLLNISTGYMEQKNYIKAEPILIRALKICEANPVATTLDYPEILNNLGYLNSHLNRNTEAEMYYKKAIELKEKRYGSDAPAASAIYGSLASFYLKTNRYAAAEKYQGKAISACEKQFASLSAATDEQQKLRLAYETREALDLYFVYAARLMPDDAQIRTRAYNFWLYRKGLLLETQRSFTEYLSGSENQTTRQLFDALNAITSRLGNLYINGPVDNSADYQSAIADAEKKKENLEVKLSAQSARFSQQMLESRSGFIEISRALPTDAALVDLARIRFSVYKKDGSSEIWTWYYAFVIKNGLSAPELIELGDVARIDKVVSDLKRQITENRNAEDITLKAKAAYQQIFMPVIKSLTNVKVVYLTTDGLLSTIPFEIFIDDNGKFLIEKYNFNYLTSARDLVYSGSDVQSGKSVVFGNPDFDWQDPVMKTRTGGVRSLFDGIYFAPLASTASEANAVQMAIGSSQAVLYTGQQATQKNFLSVVSPKILHVATHGFFLNDNEVTVSEQQTRGMKKKAGSIESQMQAVSLPKIENPFLRSGLVFAGANRYLSPESADKTKGFTTAEDVLKMQLQGTELVALSACQTGLGDVKNGEGVFGLQRAFLMAGAQNLLMSMWEVPDKETQELIILFYQNWLRKGQSKADALRNARLQMIATTRERYGFAHPFYWGAFVLLGK